MARKEFIEKRKYIRLHVAMKVVVLSAAKKGGVQPQMQALTKDLSFEGICFVADRAIACGKSIQLCIRTTSKNKPLVLRGKVMWSRCLKKVSGKEKFEIGVKLFTFTAGDENKFIGYICERMTQYFSPYLHL
ncbi:MAG: PilZ domain-containing protein [Candidatus Omnitrophota bacterium]